MNSSVYTYTCTIACNVSVVPDAPEPKRGLVAQLLQVLRKRCDKGVLGISVLAVAVYRFSLDN